MSFAASETAIPLVVDIDGGVLRTNPVHEGLARVALRRPALLPGLLPGLGRRGPSAPDGPQAEALAAVARDIPLESGAVEVIEEARARGRPIILLSAAHAWLLPALARRFGAEWVALGDSMTPADFRSRHPVFDYLGSGNAAALRDGARRSYAPVPDGRRTARSLVRSLRPHQWAKNTLLFLPAVAAHLPLSWEVVLALAAGFASFSALASAVYVLNDLADLPSDRAHPTKRRRPLAAGEVSIPLALGTAAALAVAAGLVASVLPGEFQLLLGGYVLLTTAYSLVLKKRPILDVITLAGLYTTRIAAGAAVVAVSLSRWFLAFAVFFFFSLALVKRVVELRHGPAGDAARLPGRGYHAADAPVLVALGTTAVMASSLVYCLYITSPGVGELYARPDLLWIGLPILLYWQSRVWLLVGRNTLHEDPVVFALTDRISQGLFLTFLAVVWLAS